MDLLTEHGDDGTNVAELGIGTNEKAILTGNILEDEKILGTAHVAFGASAAIGGNVQVPVHLDCVVMKPTVTLDGEPLVQDGELLVTDEADAPQRAQLLRGPQRAHRRRDRARPSGSHARLLNTHFDPAHNRSVYTLCGEPRRARGGAASPAPQHAIELIDLRGYQGLHPHIGALDVCPLDLARRGATRRGRAAAALAVADGIGELGIPVFLYGELASSEERRERAYFRQGGPAALARRMESGELVPDRGPAEPHPTRGRDAGRRAPAAGRLQPRARHARTPRSRARSPRACASRAGAGRACARSGCPGTTGARRSRSTSTTPIAVTLARGRRRRPAARRRARRAAGRGRAGRPGARGRAGGLPGRPADPRLRPRPARDRAGHRARLRRWR